MTPELQAALVNDLALDPVIMGILANRNSIYDHEPVKPVWPNIQFGDPSWIDNGDKTVPGNEITLPIHFWSQARGKKEVEKLMRAVWVRWHERANLIVDSVITITLIRHTFSNISTMGDGITRHGVTNYRIITYGG